MGLLCKAHKKLLGQPDAISLHNKWPTHTHTLTLGAQTHA